MRTLPQLTRWRPAALLVKERMLRRGLNPLAINRQVFDDGIGVLQDRGDRILSGRAGARIERPDECTDLQAVNRLLARIGRETCLKCVANIKRRGAAPGHTPPTLNCQTQ